MGLKFRQLAGSYLVSRLAPDAGLPAWIPSGSIVSITRTQDELSIVCEEPRPLPSEKYEAGWACLKLEGPFPFSLTGVLSSFLAPLAENKIPIFAMSTFDTDYVLVKRDDLARAVTALQAAGHEVV
jgi:uncharacterized protein